MGAALRLAMELARPPPPTLTGAADGREALRAAEAATTDSKAAEKELSAGSVKTDAEAGGEGGAWDGTGGTVRAGTAAAGAVGIVDSARI